MDIPTPPQAVAAFATFVRDRLVGISGTIAPVRRAGGVEVGPRLGPDSAVVAAARQFATVVVGAAAPFAATSYARARLIRQLHASGLLTADEANRASAAMALEPPPGSKKSPGAPG